MKFIPSVILAFVLLTTGFNSVVASNDPNRTNQVLQIQQLQGLVLNIQLLQKQLETPTTVKNTKYIAINRPTLPAPIKCSMEAKICPNGSTVTRTGPKCQFPACPISPIACSRDAKVCPDGSTVTRTGPKCQFPACPISPIVCPMEAKICPDGSSVGRTGPKCEFQACSVSPLPITCQSDAKICSDGSVVVRGGPRCQFPACPSPLPAVNCPLPPTDIICLDSEAPTRKSESTCEYTCSPLPQPSEI